MNTINEPIHNYKTERFHYTDLIKPSFKKEEEVNLILKPESEFKIQKTVKDLSKRTIQYSLILSDLSETLSKDLEHGIFNKSLNFYKKFEGLIKLLNDSKEILSYPDNWDDDGAKATNSNTFSNAQDFLLAYYSEIYNRFDKILPLPYFDILKDGSLYILWDTSKAKFLIIFKKDQNIAFLYAENKEKNVPFKTAVQIGEPVDDVVILWMKMNLI